MNSQLFTKDEELAHFEHMILLLETIGNDVCSQWNHLHSFELITYLPSDIIDSKLKSLRAVKKQEHSEFLKDLVDIFGDHFGNLL
jgi:hypothetical protein